MSPAPMSQKYSTISPALAVGTDEPDRNLALELVRVTEAAAIAGGHWVGFGDKNKADGAAVDAMRSFLHTVHFNGVVVIGEGEKDEAPMLFNGEHVGDGTGPECDVAVDPIDGTRLTALGINNALAVLAVAERGTMFDPSAVFYMEKLVTGPEAADMVDLRLPVKQNLHLIAKAKGVKVNQLNVMILDRDRHRPLVEEIREAGARTKFIMDGDVAGAIAAARSGTGVDALMGIGGTPKASLPLVPSSPSAVSSRAACGPPATTRSRRPSTPDTTSSASSPRTTSSRATTATSPLPASPTATSSRACATPRTRS
ncbi:fructose-1,6-bisphosphatase class 2 [Arthrobacter sp. Hiyo8]|nr:fructose-1,6-bisphosphatase class 2 [Arthrobacter sp. Hiyo8]